jgi:iron complex transport system substrate-binding protein
MAHFPERIVSLQPSATVILAGLGQMARLVACTRYCAEVCPGVRSGRLIVADSWTANSDEILAAHPDLVIAAVPYQEKAVSEILKAGIRFFGLAPRNLADIYTDIGTIAGIVGASDRGDQIIDDMKREIDTVRKQVREAPRPTVFCEEWGKPLISSQRWVAELVEAAGGEFLGEAGVERSPEAVLAENPEVLIAAWCGAGDRVPLEKIVSKRGWGEMKAVRDSRVYSISDELLNTPAPTLLRGLKAVAAAIHPQLFSAPCGLRQITRTTETRHEHLPRV